MQEELKQAFGKVIRRRRQALKLGQEDFADRAGLHRTHVSSLERGKMLPTLLVIKKLADALGTTMAKLMEELEATAEAPEDGQDPPARRPGRG